MYSDWLTYSVALCLTGVILDKLTVTYECIDWLITPVVAVCLTDVILDKLTVTSAALGDLTELFPMN